MASVLPADRWELTEKLFEEASTLPPEARLAFLDTRCGADTDLRDEVLSLLRFDTGEEPAALNAVRFAAASLATEGIAPGTALGPYRVEREIGRGGMSVVYLAVRADGEFHKRVAIKLIKRGMDTDAVLARLRQERRILAALEHPSIARLLDGGTTGDGRPWLAMEFVEGVPIHRYCEERRLSRDERCRLIGKVCDAVAYAHRNFVIHRDLKPANILVMRDGNPKLLDFGIAKLLEADSDDAAPETRVGARPLTPEYASPEQRSGGRVGIATDVYSIGVILFELLTGARPAAEVSSPRTGSDLDIVVAKALQADADRRYQSAEQFAEDLGRFLSGRPIAARPDTLGYRATMFVRRNRVAVAATASVALALAAGIVVSSREAHLARLAQADARRESAIAKSQSDFAKSESGRAKTDRDRALAAEKNAELERNKAVAEQQRADTEAATAKAISAFLRDDVLGQAKPGAGGPDLKVRTALDNAAARIEGKFKGKPLVEADVRDTIGDSYFGLGLYPEAQRQYERVRDLRRTALGERNRETLDAMTSVAVLDRVQDRLDDAERIYKSILPIEVAEFGEKDQLTMLTMGNLAVVYSHQHKYAQAEELELRVLAAQKAVLGPEHLDTLRTMNNLGVDYSAEGKFTDAERLYSQVLNIRRRVQGPAHPNTIFTLNNLAVTYTRPGGDRQAAEKLYKQALEDQRRILGADHPDTLLTMSNLGILWVQWPEKYNDAEQLLRQTAEVRERVLGAKHQDTLATWLYVAMAQILQKKFTEAESMLRPVCESYGDPKLDVWQRYFCTGLLGESLVGQKRLNEAEPLLLDSYQGLHSGRASIPAQSADNDLRIAGWLARLYSEEGKPESAANWKQKSESR